MLCRALQKLPTRFSFVQTIQLDRLGLAGALGNGCVGGSACTQKLGEEIFRRFKRSIDRSYHHAKKHYHGTKKEAAGALAQ